LSLETTTRVEASGLWDRDWYLLKYPDVAAAGVDPLEHYLMQGFKEGRDPSPFFSTIEYVANSPSVAATQINPLVHFLERSQDEIRNLFDSTPLGDLPLIPAIVPSSRPFHLRRGILLAGNFCREADRMAALWFLHEIFPLVLEKCPRLEVHLVGLQLPGWKDSFAMSGVRVWGRVSCLEVLQEECRMALVLDRGANEMTNVLRQSLGHGLPVLTTPTGALTAGLRHEETALIAGTPEGFVREITRLNEDEVLWNKLSIGALEWSRHFIETDSGPTPPSQSPSDDYFRVNFLIIGAQKCGTTALAHYLGQHPQICLSPQKEVHFFDDPRWQNRGGIDPTAGEYRNAFPNWTGQPIVGEATPLYLYLPEVPTRVAAYNPHMRIVILLREPVSRAVSHHRHSTRLGHEFLPLPLALAVEPLRLWWARGIKAEDSSVRWHSYLSRGRYTEQIRRWLEVFPRRQVLFLRQDDLLRNPRETLTRVYAYLHLPTPSVFPEPGIYNASSPDKKLPRWLRRPLTRLFQSEVSALEKLLDRNLPEWREPENDLT
jgi:hypothetical protein